MLKSYLTVGILCLINLLNYMDRFTIAGVLSDIEKYFDIDTTKSGLLQTAFICSYMIFAPLFGFLGDRYSRKLIIIVGVIFWSLTTLASSFVQRDHTALFFFFRALVGIGEASYSTVAPTIIADLFKGKRRSTCIALFYFAIPVGSGLGYIVGTLMTQIFGSWQYALRFTPFLGFAAVFAFLFITEPKRGATEGVDYDARPASSPQFDWRATLQSLHDDVAYLFSVPTFVHTTFGFTAVCFSTGALSWWAPYYMEYAIPTLSKDKVGLIFGGIACVGGIVGVVLGSSLSQVYRKRYPAIDPYICFLGVLLSIPFVFLTIFLARSHPTVSWVCIFFAITFLSTNWSVVVDILLYVIVPNRRATAQSIQILVSHILGDASSPFIIGAVSSSLSHGARDGDTKYYSLSHALYITPAVLIFGVVFFLWSARHVRKDEAKCKDLMCAEDARLAGANGDSPVLRPTQSFGNESTNNLIGQNVYSKSD